MAGPYFPPMGGYGPPHMAPQMAGPAGPAPPPAPVFLPPPYPVSGGMMPLPPHLPHHMAAPAPGAGVLGRLPANGGGHHPYAAESGAAQPHYHFGGGGAPQQQAPLAPYASAVQPTTLPTYGVGSGGYAPPPSPPPSAAPALPSLLTKRCSAGEEAAGNWAKAPRSDAAGPASPPFGAVLRAASRGGGGGGGGGAWAARGRGAYAAANNGPRGRGGIMGRGVVPQQQQQQQAGEGNSLRSRPSPSPLTLNPMLHPSSSSSSTSLPMPPLPLPPPPPHLPLVSSLPPPFIPQAPAIEPPPALAAPLSTTREVAAELFRTASSQAFGQALLPGPQPELPPPPMMPLPPPVPLAAPLPPLPPLPLPLPTPAVAEAAAVAAAPALVPTSYLESVARIVAAVQILESRKLAREQQARRDAAAAATPQLQQQQQPATPAAPSKTLLVMDTNCLLNHLDLVRNFKAQRYAERLGLQLIVPLIVLHELDGIKKYNDDLGHRARAAVRMIGDEISPNNPAHWIRGQKHNESLPRSEMQPLNNDDLLLSCCLHYARNEAPGRTALLTEDRALRVKCLFHGIPAESLRTLVSASVAPQA